MIFQAGSHVQFVAINHSIPATPGITLEFITNISPVPSDNSSPLQITLNADPVHLKSV
jgi:hypothetical protein